jgi:hypothetical protein
MLNVFSFKNCPLNIISYTRIYATNYSDEFSIFFLTNALKERKVILKDGNVFWKCSKFVHDDFSLRKFKKLRNEMKNYMLFYRT